MQINFRTLGDDASNNLRKQPASQVAKNTAAYKNKFNSNQKDNRIGKFDFLKLAPRLERKKRRSVIGRRMDQSESGFLFSHDEIRSPNVGGCKIRARGYRAGEIL